MTRIEKKVEDAVLKKYTTQYVWKSESYIVSLLVAGVQQNAIIFYIISLVYRQLYFSLRSNGARWRYYINALMENEISVISPRWWSLDLSSDRTKSAAVRNRFTHLSRSKYALRMLFRLSTVRPRRLSNRTSRTSSIHRSSTSLQSCEMLK